MSLLTLCQWLEQTSAGTGIRESIWLFPILLTIHAVSIILVVGTISVVDLRLLGLRLWREPVTDVLEHLLPWTLRGVVIMALSGALLAWSHAVQYYHSPFFRTKMLLIVLAGTNALVFHVTIYRTVGTWNQASLPPGRARLAGLLSLMLWIGVVATARAIGYE